jgi:hypothetical protein
MSNTIQTAETVLDAERSLTPYTKAVALTTNVAATPGRAIIFSAGQAAHIWLADDNTTDLTITVAASVVYPFAVYKATFSGTAHILY